MHRPARAHHNLDYFLKVRLAVGLTGNRRKAALPER